MNKARRKRIDEVLLELDKLKEAIEALPSADDIKSTVEELAEEEREYYDNMHDNLKGGERGEAADQAANELEQAASTLNDLGIDDLASKIDEIVANLEAARDGG
jgi:hypothetical protein